MISFFFEILFCEFAVFFMEFVPAIRFKHRYFKPFFYAPSGASFGRSASVIKTSFQYAMAFHYYQD